MSTQEKIFVFDFRIADTIVFSELNFNLFIFIFGCTRSSLLPRLSLQLQREKAILQLWCWGFSLQWLLLCQGTDSRVLKLQQSRHMGSIVAAPRLWSTGSRVGVQGLSRSATCGIFLNRRSNRCLLHCQSDPLTLSSRRSPPQYF